MGGKGGALHPGAVPVLLQAGQARGLGEEDGVGGGGRGTVCASLRRRKFPALPSEMSSETLVLAYNCTNCWQVMT